MSKIWLMLAKKLALNALSKWTKSLFAKNDYREVYKPISEASYLQNKCHKPKHSKAKRWIMLITIYIFTLSVAYNILLIREIAVLKENLDFILEQAHKLNKENQQIVDSLANPQVQKEFKKPEITTKKGKYVEKYNIESK